MAEPAPLLSLAVDADGCVRDADAAACAALGWSREALCGTPLAALIPDARLEPAEATRFAAQVNTAHRRHMHAEVWASAPVAGLRAVLVRETPAELDADHRLFGGRLSDLLRRQPDEAALLAAGLEAVGAELGVNRATFSRAADDADRITVAGMWTDGSVTPFDGDRSLSGVLGPEPADSLRRGETLVNPDALAHPELPQEMAPTYVERGVRALCVAPLMQGGRLAGVLSVHQREPRAWTAAEVRLLEEAAERLGEALERVAAEARLRDSEEHFRTFAEALPDLAFVMDAEGRPYWWNKRHDEVFGPGAEKTLEAVVHPDDRERVAIAFAEAIAAGRPLESRNRLMCADGRYRPFRSWAKPVRDPSGRVVRWVGMAVDVSDMEARERHQAFLLDLGERVRGEASPAGILRASARALGEFLQVGRVGYAQVDAEANQVLIEHDWCVDGLASMAGRHAFDPDGRVMRAYRTGRTVVEADLQAAPDLSPGELESLQATSIRATITVPLMRHGELAAIFSANQPTPRHWTDAEVRLVEEVAERTWAAWERAEAEARLAESEAQFRGLAENLPNLCWISAADGRVLWSNRRYREFYSWRMAEDGRIGESLTVHPDDREASRLAWTAAYGTGEPLSVLIRSRDSAGRYRPFLCQAEAIRDGEGRVVRWCGILTDLSEQQAREGTQRFLLELGEAVRALTDPNAILQETCERLAAHLGADRAGYGEFTEGTGEVMVRTDWCAPDMKTLRGVLHHYSEGSRTLAAYRAGQTLAWSDGDDLPEGGVARRLLWDLMGCRSSLSVPLARGGKLLGLFGVYKREPHAWTPEEIELVREVADRTWAALERSRAEAASRESEEQFRTFAESLPDVAFVVDAEGAPLWWNRRHEDYFGPGLGMANVANMAHPDDAGWVMEAWGRAAAAGEPIFAEFRMKCLDGQYRLFKAHASPVRDAAGQIVRWAGLVRNVHEQRARERNQAFLLEVGDKLRRLADPAEVLREAAEALRKHLDVDTTAFAEADDSHDALHLQHEATNGVLPPAPQAVRVSEWGGPELLKQYRAGQAVVLSDVAVQLKGAVRGLYEATGVRASLSVPLMIDGRLRAVFFASHAAPRDWSDGELQLAREVAERTWATVERVRAEGARRETEALLTSIMDHAPVGIYVKDAQGRYILVNPEMARLLGRPAEALIGLTAHEVVDAEYAEEITAEERRVVETGLAQVSEGSPQPGRLGSYDWSLVTRFPITTGEGAPRQVAGINVDISAQKKAEAARRETEALLTSIMDHAPVGIYVKDLEGRYALVNPEMCKLLGRPEHEIVGRTAYDVVDRDYAEEVTAHDRWVMETGGTHISERKLGYGQTGSYDWSLITRFPVTTGEGAPRQVAGINVNLSAQKAAETELERSREQLYQSEKLSALGSLLAGVSHELNNPLSIVVAQATMMERQGDGGPLAERARHIRAAAERCARIVQTFLAMARQRAPERRRTDLNGVVDAALELTAYGLRTSGVKVVRERAADLPAISADADQLHQVVINLVINAQHALAEQPGERRLVVRTAPAPEGGFVVLEIADNGPGVPDELRRRIFEPFFTTKPQDVGTGVGLSFSLGLVEAHGGRLELAETPGGGATLRVVLPILAAAEPIVAPAAVVAAVSGDLRTALVIDDEPQIARALAEFLELEGYACETVFGGGEAKARLQQGGDYDLILSDLRMPDVDGPSLFAWIKAERPELAGRVAFSTGDTLGSTAVRFLAREGRPFMEKPFTPDSLRALLDDVEAAADEATS